MTRLAMVSTNSWSREQKSMVPLKAFMPSLTAVMLSRSRWLVGSSSSSTLAPESIMRANMQRIFSPPESTLTSL